MPVLMLARGDAQSKDLLRRAIEARYGFRPPTLETLHLELKGRIHTHGGPVAAWMPFNASLRLKLPLSMRWEQTVRPLGLPIQRGVYAFDGMIFRHLSSGKPTVISDPQRVSSIHRRLWAVCAVLLTPLTEHYVELQATGERELDATNRETDDTVSLHLNSDYTLARVQTRCYCPAAAREQAFSLTLIDGQVTLGDLILPGKVTAAWDNAPYLELQPAAAKSNPELAPEIFTLGK